MLAAAKALMHWHAHHRFCANCGALTGVAVAGWRRDCKVCKATHFPRTDPVVIMLAVDGDACVLGRQPRFPKGMYSALAGFVEPGETIEAAVRREIWEETGVACGAVQYFASQPWPFPASLMIGCFAEARNRSIKVDQVELEDARWFTREEAVALLEKRHPDRLAAPDAGGDRPSPLEAVGLRRGQISLIRPALVPFRQKKSGSARRGPADPLAFVECLRPVLALGGWGARKPS